MRPSGKTLSLSFTLLVHRLTYKKMNTHACILHVVTKCNLFDHYYDPRNNKRNANHNTIENINIQDFS